ncbi:hypothetical protein ACXR2U_01100 [Jatrophihabitans sp. YIM 134969]
MIVSVCADKGSPGVSWTSTALTMVWPGDRVLLEADCSGGDAALRLRTPERQLLARQPTLRGLSVDARSGELSSLAAYTHQTSLGVPVIPATDMRTEDFALIARQWPAVASAAHAWPGTVIADLGRLQEDTASGPVAAASTVVLLIGRADSESLYHLRERARTLTARLGQGMHRQSPLAVAVVCPTREHKARVADIRAHLASDAATSLVPVAGWIADDPGTIALLRQGVVTKKVAGSDLLRSVSSVVEALLSWWPQLCGVQLEPRSPEAVLPHPSIDASNVRHAPSVPPPPGTPSMTTGGWS